MLVFITDGRSFNIKKLENKKVELIYIFNSKKLFEQLKENYKCVNISNDGIIIDENYFPIKQLQDNFKLKAINMREDLFLHYKKKLYYKNNNGYKIRHIKHEFETTALFGNVKKLLKKEISQAMEMLDKEINQQIIRLCYYQVNNNLDEIKKINFYGTKFGNYLNSFFRAYIYSFGIRKRGIEIFGDYIRYMFFYKFIENYRFSNLDVIQIGFKIGYKKVMSRLFIELIHEVDIKTMVKELTKSNKKKGFI